MNTNSIKVEKRSFEIIDGPSLHTIVDAFKYADWPNVKIPLDFKVAVTYTAHPSNENAAYIPASIRNINVRGLKREKLDDTLKISGVCEADIRTNQKIKFFKLYKFEAYYNTKIRKGRITLYET